MKKVYGIIYKITNKINNKTYIGQTTNKRGFDGRYCGNLRKNTHNLDLKRDIEKYGIDNFDIDKKFDKAYSQEELNKLEQLYIKTYNLLDSKYGYNKILDYEHIIRNNKKGKEFNRPVIDLQNLKVFNSLSDLSKYYNLNPSIVGYSLNNYYNPFVDRITYRFAYVDDFKNSLDECFSFNINLDDIFSDIVIEEMDDKNTIPQSKYSYSYNHI